MKSKIVKTETGEELQIGGERFRRCPSFEKNYLISSEGVVFTRVRSKFQGPDWVRFSPENQGPRSPRVERIWYDGSFWQNTFPAPNIQGYKRFRFSNGGVVRKKIPELVLEAFVGVRPPGQVACHINGRAGDDRLANLRWDTPEQNERDKRQHGTLYSGEKSAQTTIPDEMVLNIVRLRKGGSKLREIAAIAKVSVAQISDICTGKSRDELTGIIHIPAKRPISEQMRKEIFRKWKEGLSIRDLQKIFPVGHAGLKAIVRSSRREESK